MDLTHQKCVPCEAGTKPLTLEESKPYLEELKDWQVREVERIKRIWRKFKFEDFKSALAFVNKVGQIAEEEGHHPDIGLGWGKVEIELHTHAIGGLSTNDFILAAKINKIADKTGME